MLDDVHQFSGVGKWGHDERGSETFHHLPHFVGGSVVQAPPTSKIKRNGWCVASSGWCIVGESRGGTGGCGRHNQQHLHGDCFLVTCLLASNRRTRFCCHSIQQLKRFFEEWGKSMRCQGLHEKRLMPGKGGKV